MPSSFQKEAAARMIVNDYRAFLASRSLEHCVHSLHLFSMESTNTEHPSHSVVFDDDSTPARPTATQMTKTDQSENVASITSEQLSRFPRHASAQQIGTVRQTVASMELPVAELRCAIERDKPIYYHHQLADNIINVYLRYLDDAISRKIGISIINNELTLRSWYRDESALSAEDEKLVELNGLKWTEYTKACCALTLAEAAWRTFAEGEDERVEETAGQQDSAVSASESASPNAPRVFEAAASVFRAGDIVDIAETML